MNIPQLFGSHILALRTAHGLTQQQLADRLHVPRSNLSRVEQHGTDPLLSSLLRYARALGVSMQMIIPIEIVESALYEPQKTTNINHYRGSIS